jgi:hypothetical protein
MEAVNHFRVRTDVEIATDVVAPPDGCRRFIQAPLSCRWHIRFMERFPWVSPLDGDKKPFRPMGRKGSHAFRGSTHLPQHSPTTFPVSQGDCERSCLRFGSAGNGAFRGGLLRGRCPISVPGLRVVFAVVSPEDGSQPLTIHRCRGASGTRPARRLVYRSLSRYHEWPPSVKGSSKVKTPACSWAIHRPITLSGDIRFCYTACAACAIWTRSRYGRGTPSV